MPPMIGCMAIKREDFSMAIINNIVICLYIYFARIIYSECLLHRVAKNRLLLYQIYREGIIDP